MPATIDYGGALTLFTTGKAGFFMQGEWEVTTFLTAKTPFSMTRFPNVFGGSEVLCAGRLAHLRAAQGPEP